MISILLNFHCTKKCCPGCQLPAATSTLVFGQYLADPEAENCLKPCNFYSIVTPLTLEETELRFWPLDWPNIDRFQKLRWLRIRGTKIELFSKGQPNRMKNMASRSFQTFLKRLLHTVCSKNGNFQRAIRNTSHNRICPKLLWHVPTIHRKFCDNL